jgi:outer membrane receptor protein involved in Fe transport
VVFATWLGGAAGSVAQESAGEPQPTAENQTPAETGKPVAEGETAEPAPAAPAPAEPAAGTRAAGGGIEEIVVTARRREESMQEIPIAVSALSAEDLRDRGITNLEELTKSVPSLQMSSGQSNQIYIRGIGQRTGFVRTDGAVGVYLDDLFIPRAEGQLLDTVDVQNIQVLRGPQGTLFGKNTTGGAIVLTLAKPHDEFESYIEANFGNYDTLGARAMVNGPVTKDFFVRLAGNTIRDEGYTKDIGENRRNNRVNRQAFLLQTRWEATPVVSLDALGFYGRIHDRFPANNCRIANDQALFLEGLFVNWKGDTDPSNPTAYRANCESNSRERLGDLKTNLGDTNLNFDDDLDTAMLGVTLNWELGAPLVGSVPLGQDVAFKTILGFQIANRGPIMASDNDGGPENFSESHKPRDSDRQGLSLEFQLNGSALGGRLHYTSGLFGMRETNDEPFVLVTDIIGLDDTTLGALASMQQPTRPPPGGTTPFVGVISGPILDSQFDLENLTIGPFFQASYDLTESLQLTLGARYTAERRKTDLVLLSSDFDAIQTRLVSTGMFGPGGGQSGTIFFPYLGPGGWRDDPVSIASNLFPDEDHNGIQDFPMDVDNPQIDSKKRTFSRFTPMASLSYGLPEQWLSGIALDNVLTYVTWSNGFKSGFFEPRVTDGLVLVKQETVENREIGFKIEGFDRRVRLNAAAYSMVYKNLQLINVSTDSQGNLAVVFDNVARARIDGGELELTWLPRPDWLANLSYSENRYNYLEFVDRDLAALAIQRQVVPIDRTDEPFPVSPERTVNFGVQYMRETDVGRFVPRLDLTYKSEIFLGLDHGSALAFERDRDLAGFGPTVVFDLRLGWTNLGEDLSVAAFAKNLSDVRYLSGTASVADSVGTFNQTYFDPRRYGIEMRKTF